MNYCEQIEAMHQEIRAYVEKEHPGYKVISIESDAKVRYEPPMHSMSDDLAKLEWVALQADLHFRVAAEQVPWPTRLILNIYPDGNGNLHMDTPTVEMWTGRRR